MTNYHKEAIKILKDVEGRNKELLFEIARTAPAAFVKSYNKIHGIADRAAKLEIVKDIMDAGQKIQAIKKYRELFNVGLKDAKEAVEDMEDN